MGTPQKSSVSAGLTAGGSTSSSSSSSGSAARNLNDQLGAVAAGVGGMAIDPTRAIRPPKAYQSRKDGDFRIWVRHLEHYFTLLNVDDARKTTVLLYYLGDEASNTAFHLGIGDNTPYDNARDTLMQYFSPIETPEELRTKFHQRFQNNEETLEHFAMELRVLCSKAYPNMNEAELEDMAKQQFILGVRNAITRERLIVHRPGNLKEAIEYGRLLEVANKTARNSAPSNAKNVFATVPTSFS